VESLISEGLNLLVRWIHLIAGVMWIGSSIFFTWMNANFEKPTEDKPGVEGELWMVHGGGFYVVEKKHVAPDKLPKTLHWFKWEAMFTMLSGLVLLTMIFYLGGAALMVDADAGLSPPAAIGVGVAAIAAFWFVYDAVWRSPLQKRPWIAAAICAAVVVAVAYGLSQVLSGRAAYIHVGAMLGVSMVLNVWVHIIPGQSKLVEATRAGRPPDAAQAKRGKMRSLHNHYMTYPVLFIMLSNHFPSTYGAEWNWAVLAALMTASALVKHWMNVKDPGPGILLALLAAALALAALNPLVSRALDRADAPPPSTTTGRAIDPATAGAIRGVVRFDGAPPPPKEIALYGGCEQGRDGPARIAQVAVVDGRLADAFVRVKSGWEGFAIPPAPTDPVVVDQRGCLYAPRVVGARVGQPVTFVNSDPLFHNVRSVAGQNDTWSINMPAQGQRDTKTFRRPEVMVQTRCDVHPWMTAHVGVVEHPWFAVTGADGAFSFAGLPPGEYVVDAWHETLGVREAKAVVAPGGAVDLTFTYAQEAPR
jgi:uncharacterized membrane protein/plastocyanin